MTTTGSAASASPDGAGAPLLHRTILLHPWMSAQYRRHHRRFMGPSSGLAAPTGEPTEERTGSRLLRYARVRLGGGRLGRTRNSSRPRALARSDARKDGGWFLRTSVHSFAFWATGRLRRRRCIGRPSNIPQDSKRRARLHDHVPTAPHPRVGPALNPQPAVPCVGERPPAYGTGSHHKNSGPHVQNSGPTCGTAVRRQRADPRTSAGQTFPGPGMVNQETEKR